jgi:GNAT superfamily N-acetyltransferase
MTPDADQLRAAIEATWPPLALRPLGPFLLREGAGGGKRVSAASLTGALASGDIEAAEAAMVDMGQTPMFQLTPEQTEFDATLEARGYDLLDPTITYTAPAATLANPTLHRLASIPCEAPLAIQAEIWAEGGIGPARLAVMARATGAKSYLLGRCDDTPAATGFVACAGSIAMVHAVETRPSMRRRGAARHLMQGAANWALRQGADTISLLVVKANGPANALYASLGMTPVEGYHYRVKGKRGKPE